MFDSLNPTSILTNATTWASSYDGILLTVVGIGVGFASVRFVKSLFF